MLVRPWAGGLILPCSVRVLLGVIGLYSSMRDYLRHLMQIHGMLQSMLLCYSYRCHSSSRSLINSRTEVVGLSPTLTRR